VLFPALQDRLQPLVKESGMFFRAFTLVLILSAFLGATALSGENRGAEQITLHGGSRGTVSFPHLKHQGTLADCTICHTLFPQQAGSIDKLKSEGVLVSKQVMNTLCLKCHRAEQRAGRNSGPTMCSKCHRKG
jgi:hypothetical protein